MRELPDGCIQTYSGCAFDPANPKSQDLSVNDIAHALSMTCRFGGHCKNFYSVAEHTILTSVLCRLQGFNLETQFAALHHDDTEAYLVDIPRPIKAKLPAYKDAESNLEKFLELELHFKINSEVKWADSWLLEMERRALLDTMIWPQLEQFLATTDCPRTSGFHNLIQQSGVAPKGYRLEASEWYFWKPDIAEAAFLNLHYELRGKINAQ